jgi:alanyl-tRNA synthetase
MTIRLFDLDSHQFEFEAAVLEAWIEDGRPRAVLDRTLFFPESGGQPSDRGELGGSRVLDVIEQDDRIVHVLDRPVEPGLALSGRIDRERRFDAMQQHSGQHVLSAAFVETCGVQTVSFHLGETVCTIDLNSSALDDEAVRRAEKAANQIVFENRPVTTREVDYDEALKLPLRKPPETTGKIRLVEIQDFDLSACCGTHVRNTGEIGLIKILRREKYKLGIRLTFVCGWRAWADLDRKTAILREAGRVTSWGEDDIPAGLIRLQGEQKAASRRIKTLVKSLAEKEAAVLIALAESAGGVKIVSALFESRDAEEVRELVQAVVNTPSVMAAVGLTFVGGTIFIARSANLTLDVRPLIREAAGSLSGKGGGSPAFGQAHSDDPSKVKPALAVALGRLRGTA